MGHLDAEPTDYLSNVDPVMRRLIEEIGPFTLKLKGSRSPFESLVRAIAYQQLHDKVAESILKRFIALFPGRRFPRPDELLAMHMRSVRKAGSHDRRFWRFVTWPQGPSTDCADKPYDQAMG